MSFVLNNYQQISLFDSLGFLSERKQKILDKSWAKPFSDHIFSNIDEMLFAPFTAIREIPVRMPRSM